MLKGGGKNDKPEQRKKRQTSIPRNCSKNQKNQHRTESNAGRHQTVKEEQKWKTTEN